MLPGVAEEAVDQFNQSFCQQFGKANSIALKGPTMAQEESLGVAKVLQSEKDAIEILDTMDILTPEKCKNPNKNARNGRIGHNGDIGDRAKQGLVVQLVAKHLAEG